MRREFIQVARKALHFLAQWRVSLSRKLAIVGPTILRLSFYGNNQNFQYAKELKILTLIMRQFGKK